jgi:rubredoxin
MNTCPKCKSTKVGNWIGPDGLHYHCRVCKNVWKEEKEDKIGDKK